MLISTTATKTPASASGTTSLRRVAGTRAMGLPEAAGGRSSRKGSSRKGSSSAG